MNFCYNDVGASQTDLPRSAKRAFAVCFHTQVFAALRYVVL